MEVEIEVKGCEDFYVQCPFCGSEDAEIQFADYVDKPMVWCWKNYPHSCRAVLDCSIDFMSEKEEEAYKHFENNNQSYTFKVPLCKIIGVADSDYHHRNISKYVCDNIDESKPYDKCDKENFCSKHEDRGEYVLTDTYNVVCEETKDLCLDHDGLYIYLKCLNSKGHEFRMKYWGD